MATSSNTIKRTNYQAAKTYLGVSGVPFNKWDILHIQMACGFPTPLN